MQAKNYPVHSTVKTMRFQIAYYLMLLYLLVMFKPLIPVISDALSHTFGDAIHLATVHAVYGSNHVEKELAETGADTDESKSQNTTKGQEPMPVHLSGEATTIDFTLNTTDKNYPSFLLYNLLATVLSKDAPPPKLG